MSEGVRLCVLAASSAHLHVMRTIMSLNAVGRIDRREISLRH
jgi:hypothetical protein